MKHNIIKATISGFNCENEPFTETCKFEMVPPSDSTHYGTGYYMMVNMPSGKDYIDVRYERTTDVKTLAASWIKDFYGKNAREIVWIK